MQKLMAKRASMRQELDLLATRDESLQKNKNQTMLKINELERAIEEEVESLLIDNAVELAGAELG